MAPEGLQKINRYHTAPSPQNSYNIKGENLQSLHLKYHLCVPNYFNNQRNQMHRNSKNFSEWRLQKSQLQWKKKKIKSPLVPSCLLHSHSSAFNDTTGYHKNSCYIAALHCLTTTCNHFLSLSSESYFTILFKGAFALSMKSCNITGLFGFLMF